MERVFNWMEGSQQDTHFGDWADKVSPHTGQSISKFPLSGEAEIAKAVAAAESAQKIWAKIPAVQRGALLFDFCQLLENHCSDMAKMVALETGKSLKDALGETRGAIQLGRFYAGEGQRLYGKTMTSGQSNRFQMSVRQPCGVAALIVPANTPIANIAWKVFPAMICGNSVVLKSSEDAPGTAHLFSALFHKIDFPKGVFNIVHGYGKVAGAALVKNENVRVVSFTGSTAVGKEIAQICGQDLKKVSLELGGKNPLVVCDDADLDEAVKWSLLSAFSNAGQRCASASRLIVFESIYSVFKEKLLKAAEKLKVGPSDSDDLGPVINLRQLEKMLSSIKASTDKGAKVLLGGRRLETTELKNGFYMAPTILENVSLDSPITCEELFGPITALYPAKNFEDALRVAAHSPYGLTSAIHTRNVDRAIEFARRLPAGVVTINGGTYGSEPHMPFGGVKASGNGTREPGTEALDIYSDLKNICFVTQTAL